MDEPLHGKTAIITGASSGIGKATALALAREHVNLALASRRPEILDDVCREVRESGSAAFARPTDTTDPAAVCSLVEETVKRFGRVDIVIANAGVYIRRPAAQLAVADIRKVMEVNFFGSLHLVYAALPAMLRQESGHIVVVSSVDGKKGLPPDTAYVSSKFALTGFMDVLRQELHGTGVYATTILPARVDTPMIAGLQLPFFSRAIASERVAKAILRAIRTRRAEVLVPWAGPKALIVANSLSPRLGDWLVRLFRLEGEEGQQDMSHKNGLA